MKAKNYIDNLYYTLFGSYLVVCVAMAVMILILNVNDFFYGLAWVMLASLMVIGFCFYDRRYYLEKDSLKITVCFITITIPYKNIQKIYMTQNNRISYATSQKRIGLKIKGKKNDIFISPENMDKIFLKISENLSEKNQVSKTSKKVVKK